MENELKSAIRLFDAQRLAESETLCRQVLVREPRNADAMHLLGLIALRCGHVGPAEQLIRQAITFNPNHGPLYCSLTNVLCAVGNLAGARAAIGRALELEPDSPGNLNNLAMVCMGLSQFDEAIAACRRATVLAPADPGGFYNLAIALKAKGELDEAIAPFRQAIALSPQFDLPHFELAKALHVLNRWGEAEGAYRDVLRLNPTHFDAQHNLGLVLHSQDRSDEALPTYRRAMELKPDSAQTLNNIANVLRETGQVDAALRTYREAVALAPAEPMFQSNLIFSLLYQWPPDPGAIRREQAVWNERFIRPLRSKIRPHRNDRDPDRPLKIGYVSNDFRQHVSALFLRPLLRHQDRQQFQTTCYVHGVRPDAVTEDFHTMANQWRVVDALSDEQLAERVREDGIDILVDLKLHTAGTRLAAFGYKPAPVQISWLSYAGSAGVETIDYRLSDPFLEPPGLPNVDPDRPLHLPACFWCYDPTAFGGPEAPEPGPPPVATAGYFTFGCLNAMAKLNAGVIETWARVLHRVPGSRLRLHARTGSHRARLLGDWAAHGIESSRIILVPSLPREQYLTEYHHIDLALDPFPYCGGTTSFDATWMGVPIVTLIGDAPMARAGYSQLSNVGLADELAAATTEQYIERAVALAGDLSRLAELRLSMRSRVERSPLMDGAVFARGVEAAYRTAWREWCAATV